MTILSGDERDKIVQVIEFLARHKSRYSVADIKKKFNLTSEEYEMCMDLAMPSIRFSNSARFYIQAFRHLSWQIEVYLLGLKRIDEGSDKKPTVSELYKKTIEYMKNILQEADIRWIKSKDVYDTSSILPENTKLNTWDEEEDDIA